MTRRRLIALVAVWTLPSAIFLAIAGAVYARHRLEMPPRLSADARAAAMAVLRGALDAAGKMPTTLVATPQHPELVAPLPDGGPVVATVWLAGRPIVRVDGHGRTTAAAVVAAAEALRRDRTAASLEAADRARARIKVDRVVARSGLGAGGVLFDWFAFDGLAELVPLNPGNDGIGVTLDGGAEQVLVPDELIQHNLLTKRQMFKAIPDWSMGLDRDRADALLALRAQLPAGGWGAARRTYWRLRTDSFVERPEASRPLGPLPLERGVPPGPELTAAALREAALSGARYLVAHLSPSGRYVYEHNLATGAATDVRSSSYSIPRHAGTTYFLAEIYRITREEFLREPIERAFGHLQELIEGGRCNRVLPDGTELECVVDRGEKIAALGSTALTVVALAEYQRATGDKRYLPLATKLTAWILYMQRPDGSFAHLYNIPKGARDEKTQQLYYSGEAALALARMHVVTGDARYAEASGRALDWLVDWYDFFLGGFLYGEEHWTCIAAEAIWPAVKRDAYREFCDGYGRFLRKQQPAPGDRPDQEDLAGAYGVTPFVMPYNTPAGSRTEAMISAYLLGQHHGGGDPEIRRQILAALRYLLRQQVRPESDWNVAAKDALGGIPGSPLDRTVRIDYVQHVCSAMIRATELGEAAPP